VLREHKRNARKTKRSNKIKENFTGKPQKLRKRLVTELGKQGVDIED
jgi:hypothetical protein